MDYEKFGCTSIHGDFYYYNYNSACRTSGTYALLSSENPIFFRSTISSKTGRKEVFLDVNGLSQMALPQSVRGLSVDGSLFAYGCRKRNTVGWTGFRRMRACSTRNIQTTRELSKDLPEKHKFHSLYYHKLGTDCKNDVLVADFRNNENFMCDGSVTEDGKYLIVGVSKGCDPTNQIYFYDLQAAAKKLKGSSRCLRYLPNLAKYDFVDNDGASALLLTNYNSAMFKLIRVKMNSDAENPSTWETVIEEDPKRKLEWVAPVAGNKMWCPTWRMSRLLSMCMIWKPASCFIRFRFQLARFESFLTPTIIYQADFSKCSSSSVPIQLGPMFILHNKDVVMDGKNPTMLNGYGASTLPILHILPFARPVSAELQWNRGCRYLRVEATNVFDDFIAAAEYLIDNKWTSPEKLAIHGGSNGGLLVAACSQQRPELYGAVLNRVGVLDMLRFHKFTIGAAWIPEYGNPDDANDFEFIYKYSPLHNIRLTKDVQWPSTLLMTGDHDDRVSPLHTLKYIAELYHFLKTEAAGWQKNPVLARIEINAGHGAGKPTTKVIAEIVDMYCFLQRTLGMEWKD
uniref:Prolyl endopeptidase n=1 Tax=Ditylenchus dipsaci TaxID=166011 RepID=A0A915CSW3_9BILA